jgi:cell division protein FtsQ
VILSPREAWQVRLDDGLLIELGRDEEEHPIGERLERFVDYYRSAADQTQVDATVADMRYPNGFALRVVRKS